jgi:hypothetical protein
VEIVLQKVFIISNFYKLDRIYKNLRNKLKISINILHYIYGSHSNSSKAMFVCYSSFIECIGHRFNSFKYFTFFFRVFLEFIGEFFSFK